ncbi:Hsp70 family protein [Vitiosangium sp. GDMCC 1.1324]|uniref:Hsp70 family protein n=1 Tax=Vitiosangium sp. (strain GDMCC 1.1324) TaxID=2138576 RepID=UPI000D3A5F8E|nr:Hsp70 family protein [Vitiosangium sp. GDMCC 1.1324]PTL78659.1 molecular chaperone DnaK [Vitiosangium sp. GDMCC 1.1324]
MHIVGIDLGTTHCAVASVDPSKGPTAPVEDFPVPQLVRQGEVSPRSLLPSCVYVPAGHELATGSLRLPWGESGQHVVGELARWQGARVPGRVVTSAKSWLCHPGVDRSAPILPWGAPADVAKLSPVEASALLLSHMARAWNHAHPEAPLSQQEVVITVPASFDEAARALTVSAARKAGLEKFTLLEEPQAAFYDYTARHRKDLAKSLEGVRLVLVVDVGGGTTDFTLVHAGVSPEGPMLRRLAVGEHLMLGGDNMDAALAKRVEEKLFPNGNRRLSATQWTQAIQAARTAKEALLGTQPPERYGVSLVAEGSRLLGGSLSTDLTREEAETLVMDGFFPRSGTQERPRRVSRMALQELGLPYAQDAAITRHLAAFLAQHAAAGFAALGETAPSEGALPRPDAILLNGGVFNSPRLSERLVDAVSAWWPGAPRIRLLKHESLELAVARGAAYYGLVRRGHGLRIGGGAARAYYVALQRPADSSEQPVLCLIPRGFEEGNQVDIGERSFTLTLGRPVQFTLYSTTSDRIDKPGDVVTLTEDLKPLPPIHTVLKGAEGKTAEVPVHLQAGLTEIGTLELFAVSNVADERWRLEFELRGTGGERELTVTESMPARFAEAKENVERVFGNKPLPIGPKDVKQLSRTLEKVLGPRETWRVPVLRELWSSLFAGASKRRRTADHERVFYSLAGYTLRPGFGYPLDHWRAEQTFSLFEPLVQHHTEKSVWIEFWVMWRRMAGGLSEAQQRKLYDYLKPHLARKVPLEAPPQHTKLKGIQPEGLDEMVRTAASLEHLEPGDKAELGQWVAARLKEENKSGGPWAWALGRLGARVPLYGSSHKVVDVEVAEAWLSLLLELDLKRIDGAPFAAAQLARLTGDRMRDISPELRAKTANALRAAKAADTWVRMVTEVVALEAADEARALGDTLPAGLRL